MMGYCWVLLGSCCVPLGSAGFCWVHEIVDAVPKASAGKNVIGITQSRVFVLERLSSVPLFNEDDVEKLPESALGQGQFGSVSVFRIKHLDINVAAKEINKRLCSKKAVYSEVVVMLSLSGNKYFPYCYGLFGDNHGKKYINFP